MQIRSQLEQEKISVPLKKEDIAGKYEIAKIQEKARLENSKQDFKGKMSDIQEQNIRERAILNKQLEAEFADAPSIKAQPVNQ